MKKLFLLTGESFPFFYRALKAELSPAVLVEEAEASSHWGSIQNATFAPDEGALWVVPARDWLIESESEIRKRLENLLTSHPRLFLVLPWTVGDEGYGPWAWLSKESPQAQLRRRNERLLENPLWADRLISAEALIREMGERHVYDPRWQRAARMPWTREFQERLATHVFHFFQLRTSGSKKVLAVDFDNTLWPGILSEDEVHLEPGTLEGDSFRAFQEKLLQLRARGIHLVGLSRNDPQLIEEKWDQIPGLLLKQEHFSLIFANWERKSRNLQEAAQSLGLGLDSCCFIDDDAAEIHMMRSDLPQVECLHLGSDPALRVQQLEAMNWFWSFHLTDEDRGRQTRPALSLVTSASGPFTDLSEMQIEVRLSQAEIGDLPRLHQLVGKTNQFNLITARWSLNEIHARLTSSSHRVWVYRIKDRYEDLGLVGAIFLKLDGISPEIENWIMSCRAFSRQIEPRVWSELLALEKGPFATRWIDSGKNAIALKRLTELGFQASETEKERRLYFGGLDAH